MRKYSNAAVVLVAIAGLVFASFSQASGVKWDLVKTFSSYLSGVIFQSPSEKMIVITEPWAYTNVDYDGAFWIYMLEAAGWSSGVKYQPNAPEYALSGTTIAATDSKIISGAPSVSAIYPYTFDGQKWNLQSAISGTSSTKFGDSLAMDDSMLLVGATGALSNKGSVSVYTVGSDGQWKFLATLTSSTSGALGTSAALSSKLILSGAINENSSKGALYLWTRTSSTSVNPTSVKLTVTTSTAIKFGQSAAIISDTLIAVGTGAGSAVYIFTFATTWSLSSTVNAPSGYSNFGKALSFSGKNLLVTCYKNILVYTLSGTKISDTYTDITPSEVGNNYVILSSIRGNNIVATFENLKGYLFKPAAPIATVPTNTTAVVVPTKSKSEKLGYQVAIWNDIAIISVPFCIVSTACDGGYILLFKKDSSSGAWKYLKTIRNPFRNRDNKFGSTISVNNYYLVVSVPLSNYVSTDIGIVVFYRWDNSKQTFTKVSNARFRRTQQSIKMGSSISNMDDITVFGMPEYNKDQATTQIGCVHVMMKLVTGKWRKRITITAATQTAGERFGHSVSMQSKTRFAVSNNPGSSSSATQAVFIYNFVNDVWTLFQTIPSGGLGGFGWKIAFFDGLLYISAPLDSTDASSAGSIYTYQDDGTGQFIMQGIVKPKIPIENGRFGYSFSSDGTRLAATSKPCDDGVACGIIGRVYTFTKDSGKWTEQYVFESIDPTGSDGYGHDVAVKGDTVLVSAPTNSTLAPGKGVGYFIRK